MIQNTSHAVMSQRQVTKDIVDDFPTPPWATEALFHYILQDENTKNLTCLEPACGRGYMAEVLKRHFHTVVTSDKYKYGYGSLRDFVEKTYPSLSFDWVITNPPFRLAEEFVSHSLKTAKIGIAIFARTVWLEGKQRYISIFNKNPPAIFAPFVERVSLVKGRIDPKISTATSYSWFVWLKHQQKVNPKIIWIPPCRNRFEAQYY